MKRLVFYILLVIICNINTFAEKNTVLPKHVYINHSEASNDLNEYLEGKFRMWIKSPLVCDTILVIANIHTLNYEQNYEITIRLYELKDENILKRKKLIELYSCDYEKLTKLGYDRIIETKPVSSKISYIYRNYKDLVLEYVAFNEYAWLDNYFDFQKLKMGKIHCVKK